MTPEQYIAGLTDFGPGRSKLFGNSADEYLKVHHSAVRRPMSPKARAAFGNACTTTGPIPTTSSSRRPTPTCGAAHPATHTNSRVAQRPTDIDVDVVREGKNFKGRMLGLVLRTIGKGVLEKAFVKSVRAIEARIASRQRGLHERAAFIRACPQTAVALENA